ncbi:MAG: hypothetical protein DDT37_01956 [Firmicutes bacterium]|nr:hypothetical protein [candidate division NPL-UPA2 bacterium]
MSETLRVLGQAAPAATTDVNVYTVPAARATVVSSLVVCNRGTAAGTFRVAVRPAGAVIASLHYLYFGTSLAASSTLTATLGLTMAATDVVTVHASSADFSFSLFGAEVVV